MFYPGGGRPKGSLNSATLELKEFWNRFFTSPEYRNAAKKRILDGSAPHLESYLLNKIYGKPRESLDVHIERGDGEDLSMLSAEELTLRAEHLLDQLRDARAVEAQLNLARGEVIDGSVVRTALPETSQECVVEVPDDDTGRPDTLQDMPQVVDDDGVRSVPGVGETRVQEESEEEAQ
jgi:hypothetical protein